MDDELDVTAPGARERPGVTEAYARPAGTKGITLEDVLAALERDPGTVIAHEDRALLVVGHHGDVDRGLPRRIRERVEHEVREHLGDVERARDLRQRVPAGQDETRARVLGLDGEGGRDLGGDGTDVPLLVDAGAADGVPGEVARDAGALLDDLQRVGDRLGGGLGRACLFDPTEQNGERVRHVVKDAREIAVGIGRLRHGRDATTKPRLRHPRRFAAQAAVSVVPSSTTTPSAPRRTSASAMKCSWFLSFGWKAGSQVLADPAQEDATKDGSGQRRLTLGLPRFAKRLHLACTVAEGHAVLTEQRARRLDPEAAEHDGRQREARHAGARSSG